MPPWNVLVDLIEGALLLTLAAICVSQLAIGANYLLTRFKR